MQADSSRRQIGHFWRLATVNLCTRRSRKADLPGTQGSATLADAFQPRIHLGIFGADRIDIFCGIDLGGRNGARWRPAGRGGRRGRGGLVVTGEPGVGVRHRFAIRRLRQRGLAERADRGEFCKKSHFNSILLWPMEPDGEAADSKSNCDYSDKSKSLLEFCCRNMRMVAPACPSVKWQGRKAPGRRDKVQSSSRPGGAPGGSISWSRDTYEV